MHLALVVLTFVALFTLLTTVSARCYVRSLEAPPSELMQAARLHALCDRLSSNSLLSEEHPEVAGILRLWQVLPSRAGSWTDPERQELRLQMTHACDGSFWDDETVLRVLLHEVAHAQQGVEHDDALWETEHAFCSCAERAGLLEKDGHVDDFYPAQLM